MPGLYVLIVILAGGLGAGSGSAAFSTEFNSLDACQAAQKAIAAKVPAYRQSGDFVTVVKCFRKGAKASESQP
ncbi:MAG: hypothetical protein ACHQRJ_08910 [Alphaproteobacteria bacterium]